MGNIADFIGKTGPCYWKWKMLEQWNSKVRPWLQIRLTADAARKGSILVKAIAAVRSNLYTAADLANLPVRDVELFDKCWETWKKKLVKSGYEISPARFGSISSPQGKVIHTCSGRVSKTQTILVVPGVKQREKTLLNPVTLVIHPASAAFPKNHPYAGMAPQWRGILGDLNFLIVQLKIQRSVVCGIESIDKTALLPLIKHRKAIIQEVTRRRDALRESVRKKAEGYQLATNYWRVEECFWAIFHDDDRPFGYSCFDSLCKRIQEWQPTLRQAHQISVQHFLPKKDTLSAINKNISGMVLKKKSKVPAGIVLRELRPAVIVKENTVSRTLPGRVVST